MQSWVSSQNGLCLRIIVTDESDIFDQRKGLVLDEVSAATGNRFFRRGSSRLALRVDQIIS